MAFSFSPQQPQQSQFQSPFQQQQQPSPFQPQQQQQQPPFQLQLQQQQPVQPQPQLYLFTNDKVPATYGTKWADLHPDSQKVLLQIEERVLEYRGESQRLDQCSRLYDSSVSNNGFELDASYIVKEHGGVSIATERQKATLQELMTVVKEMLRNTEIAVRSFMMLRPRFLHQNKVAAPDPTAPSQTLGATGTHMSGSQAAANSMVPVFDFYSGLPNKPSPFLQQTVSRFDKYLSECRQWIEELEQLLLLDSEKNSLNPSSSLLQSLPKVLTNVHDFFVYVAAKVESIHQYIQSMKTAYLSDQRRRGEESNPFLEADRREMAKQEAATRRVHPTLHLPSVSQATNQVPGPLPISAPPVASTVANTLSSIGSGPSLFSTLAATSSNPLFSTPTASTLFSTPTASTLFSTPTTSNLFSTPTTSNLFSTPTTSNLFSTPTASTLFSTPTASTPLSSMFGTAPTSQPSPFGSTPFASTPASGVSNFTTPFATGAAAGSGASFGTQSKSRAKSRSGRR